MIQKGEGKGNRKEKNKKEKDDSREKEEEKKEEADSKEKEEDDSKEKEEESREKCNWRQQWPAAAAANLCRGEMVEAEAATGGLRRHRNEQLTLFSFSFSLFFLLLPLFLLHFPNFIIV